MNKPLLWQCLRFLGVIASMVILYITFRYIIILFYPFLIAFAIATIIHPLVCLLEQKAKLSRGLATFSVIFGCVILLFGIIVFMIFEVIEGAVYLSDKLPNYFEQIIIFIQQFINSKIIPFYETLMSWIQTLDNYQQFTIQEHIQLFTNQIATAGATFLRTLLLMIPATLAVFPQSLTILLFIIIATFIITKDWPMLKNIFITKLPASFVRASKNVFRHLEKSVFGFFKAQMIIISISSIIIFIGLCILKIEHAFTIALLIGIVDLLPLLGTGIVFLPWIGYLFLTHNYYLTIGLTVLYMVLIISRQIIEPKILSTSIGLNPLVALIILFFSIQLWGVIGILIAPLLLIIISALYQAGIIKQLARFIKGDYE